MSDWELREPQPGAAGGLAGVVDVAAMVRAAGRRR